MRARSGWVGVGRALQTTLSDGSWAAGQGSLARSPSGTTSEAGGFLARGLIPPDSSLMTNGLRGVKVVHLPHEGSYTSSSPSSSPSSSLLPPPLYVLLPLLPSPNPTLPFLPLLLLSIPTPSPAQDRSQGHSVITECTPNPILASSAPEFNPRSWFRRTTRSHLDSV